MPTMFGHYCWWKLPFGLSCSLDLFNHRLQELYQGVDNSVNIVDDMMVYAFNEEGSDHDQAFVAVLQLTQANNLKFDPDKFIFCTTQLGFFGHVLSRQGLQPDPNKGKCIEDFPKLTKVSKLQYFLGLMNYMSRFIPDLSIIV